MQRLLALNCGVSGVVCCLFLLYAAETVQLICRPPRGTHIAYADLTATPLGSKQKGYDLFKQFAAVEQVGAFDSSNRQPAETEEDSQER